MGVVAHFKKASLPRWRVSTRALVGLNWIETNLSGDKCEGR